MSLRNALRKAYRIRLNVKGRKSFIVALPYEVVEREARKRELSIEDFLAKYHAIAQYNSFEGVRYTFEAIPKEASSPEPPAA